MPDAQFDAVADPARVEDHVLPRAAHQEFGARARGELPHAAWRHAPEIAGRLRSPGDDEPPVPRKGDSRIRTRVVRELPQRAVRDLQLPDLELIGGRLP